MSLGQSLVLTIALIGLFSLAVAGIVAFVMTRPPRRREPMSLLPPRPRPALHAVPARPRTARRLHPAGPAAGSTRSPGDRRDGRAAA
ncbi:MAG TPA: hypothetical protein VID68_01725 [Solirubrobacteraceae bacterium]|jgi:hypothetical protein